MKNSQRVTIEGSQWDQLRSQMLAQAYRLILSPKWCADATDGGGNGKGGLQTKDGALISGTGLLGNTELHFETSDAVHGWLQVNGSGVVTSVTSHIRATVGLHNPGDRDCS